MHQICYLLAQVQKPGSDQGQVWVFPTLRGAWCHIGSIRLAEAISFSTSQMNVMVCGHGTVPAKAVRTGLRTVIICTISYVRPAWRCCHAQTSCCSS